MNRSFERQNDPLRSSRDLSPSIRLAVVGAILLAGLQLFSGAIFAAPINPGAPTYSWLFDEPSGLTANAHTGGINGTLENSPARVTDTPFAYAGNGAISVSGGSNVNFGNNAAFEFVNTTFTMSQWVKVPATSARMMIASKATVTAPNGPSEWAYQFEIRATTSRLGGAALTGSSEARLEEQSGGALVDNNTWRHVAVIVSTVDANGPGPANPGGGEVRLFLDGVELATTVGDNDFQVNGAYTGAPNAPLRLGARGAGVGADTGTGLNGIADEFAIYDRALTGDEVLWLAQNSLSSIPEPATLALAALGALIGLRRPIRTRF